MAPFGKVYTYPGNPRFHRALVIANLNGLELEVPPFVIRETNTSPEFVSKFPLGKVPAFEGADGFCLTESVAIATYFAKSGPYADQLMGSDAKSQALIQQWAHFTEADMFGNTVVPYVMAVMKLYAPDEKRFNDCITGFKRDVKYLEVSLKGKKYLVGDKLTFADYMVTSNLYIAFKHFIDAEWRKELPNLVAYAQNFAADPEHKKVYGELELCEKAVSFSDI
ncbi:glutathione S-transferase [Astrocystis sublimbata]|nr:glutathione S-transferase [Astrocystis sublimbata]